VNFAITNHVPDERRDYERRSAAQCRVVESVCHHLEGATCDETAAAASISATGAHRVLQRLASKHLVHCDGASRWRADPVLVSPPALCRVEPTHAGGELNGCSAAEPQRRTSWDSE
jgi:hypothetical protein